MTNFIPYSYTAEYQQNESISSDPPQAVISQQGRISIPQPENSSYSPILKSQLSPSKSSNFTSTVLDSSSFPAPMRRRRTEPIFSFEAGPTFSDTSQLCDILSMDQTNSYQVQLHAKMDRGFFKADNDWTCYRRNYFQVSSSFDVIERNYPMKGAEIPCLVKYQERLFQVDYFSIGITARVTNNDKKIELVQHTPKRDKGPQIIPEPRPLRAGGNLHLAPIGPNNNIVTFERLQFKSATANNGKRRAAQQYYEIVIDLYANSTTTLPIRVATCASASLVVRGRSPGHYTDVHHTRVKHAVSSPPRNPMLMAASKIDINKGQTIEYPSPNHNHASLPNSPLSELGPFSPYGGYPYSSFMQPDSNVYQQVNYTTSSAGGPVSTPYFENAPPPPQMYHDKPNYGLPGNEFKNDSNNYFMGYNRTHLYQQEPYNQSHNEDASSYSSSHDAGH